MKNLGRDEKDTYSPYAGTGFLLIDPSALIPTVCFCF